MRSVCSLRRVAMVLLARLLSRVAGTSLTDVTSGYRAFGPRAVDVLSRELGVQYLADTVDALVLVSRAGLTVRQVPVAMRVRQGGVPSQSPLRAATHLVRAVLVLALSTVRSRPAPAAVRADGSA